MDEKANSEERARIERAKRLRGHIDRLKQGSEPEPDRPKSLKEQISEKTREREPGKTD